MSVLVAIGMMGVMATIFSSMMVYQSRETYALTQKMKLLDFEMELKMAMFQPHYCDCLFRKRLLSTTNNQIELVDGLSRLPDFYETPIPQWPKLCQATSQDLARQGGPVRGADAIVKSIELSELRSGGEFLYRGRVVVHFELSNSTRAMQPATAPVALTVSELPSAFGSRTITGCVGSERDPWKQIESLVNQKMSQILKARNPSAVRGFPEIDNPQILQEVLRQLQGVLTQ